MSPPHNKIPPMNEAASNFLLGCVGLGCGGLLVVGFNVGVGEAMGVLETEYDFDTLELEMTVEDMFAECDFDALVLAMMLGKDTLPEGVSVTGTLLELLGLIVSTKKTEAVKGNVNGE